ncbi:MAG: S41 family peptidase [Gemmatimonadales bacterium]|nr:S41 family peptidase [Gemmatimonadales bacterium]
MPVRRPLLALIPLGATLAAALATGPCAAQKPAPPPPLPADSVAALRQAPLTPEAMRADLDRIDAAFRALHPGLFRYHTDASWRAALAEARAWAGVPRPTGEAFVAFSRLVASLRCGHTYLSFWNQPAAVHRWLTDGADKLPFEYDLAPGDVWVVTRSATFLAGDSLAILPGDTVTAVNGVATAALVRELLPLLRADGDNDGKRRALLDFRHRKQYEAIDVFLPLVHPPEAGRYTVTRRRGGETRTVTVAAMPAAKRMAEARPVPPVRPAYELTRLPDGSALLRVDGFEYGEGSDQWAPFVRRTFRALRQDGVTHLVVDLRENEGGSDEGAALLLQHLIRTPVTLPPLRRFTVYDTVPAALRPLLSTWDRGFYDRRGRVTPKGDGTFDLREKGDWPATIPVAPDAFTGRITLLTSYVNSSASHLLLRLLARRPGITLVGDPTGGSLRAHTGGNLFFMRLPGTGFEVDLPLIAYDWGADQPSGGVEPDVRVPAKEAGRRASGEAGRP